MRILCETAINIFLSAEKKLEKRLTNRRGGAAMITLSQSFSLSLHSENIGDVKEREALENPVKRRRRSR